MMTPKRIFAGDRLRALRRARRLGQAEMAGALAVSVSYLSQMESGDRPITPAVLAALARAFPADWTHVDESAEAALLVDALEAGGDPSVEAGLDEPALRRAIQRQPRLARRLVALHRAYRRSQDQLRVLDDRVDTGRGGAQLPWERVRDWFHDQRNYIDGLDRAAEAITDGFGEDAAAVLERLLRDRHGVRLLPAEAGAIRAFDPAARTLRLDPLQTLETQRFQMAYQFARLDFADAIAAIANGIAAGTERELLEAGLTNYAAGALLMPYERFRAEAHAERHDVDRLRRRFGTSFEQTCHRLSTLQRPGLPGLPFFFCRVDMAGNITKRHSATPLLFARFGGACPLWIVHEAVAIPDRILVQLAETPDGVRYVSMAKGLVKPALAFARSPRRYAVALGCEAAHAERFVYADVVRPGGIAVPIGTSCRICPRPDCDQRAFPPAAADIQLDHDHRGAVPYVLR